MGTLTELQIECAQLAVATGEELAKRAVLGEGSGEGNTFYGQQSFLAAIGSVASFDPVGSNLVGWRATVAGLLDASVATNPALRLNRKSSDGQIAQFRREGLAIGSISITTTAVSFNTTSDYRAKQNIQPLTGALARLALLKPSRFQFKADPGAGMFDGFIAHEVATVCPEAVSGAKDAVEQVDGVDAPLYQAMDAAKLVPLLVAALQEAVARIAALEAR